jgi:hypothetical protein
MWQPLLKPDASRLTGAIRTLFKAVAFFLRPRVFLCLLVVLVFIAIGEHVQDALLIPVILALLYWALHLRLRDE